jgi:predicted Zn-dependent protease
MADAWEKYVSLTNRPDPTLALSMARAYALLGQYGKAASTWETVAGSQPSAHAFECLAVSSYAAGDSRKAQLAAAKALSLLPKVQQPRLKQLFTAAKTSPKTARGFAASC